MSKTLLLLVLILAPIHLVLAQTFELRPNKRDAPATLVQNNKVDKRFSEKITSLFIKSPASADAEQDFQLVVAGNNIATFKGKGDAELKMPGDADFRSKQIEIKKGGAVQQTFTLVEQPVFQLHPTIGSNALPLKDGISTTKIAEPLKEIFISTQQPTLVSTSYKVFVDGKDCGTVVGDGGKHKIACPGITDLRDVEITLKDATGNIQFDVLSIPKTEADDNGNGNRNNGGTTRLRTVVEEVRNRFPSLTATTYGLQVPAPNSHTGYTGRKYIHIFLDQFGNNIFSTIPQGVANRQYVVHIFYMIDVSTANQVSYSINQTSGEFQDALVFNNAGQLSTIELRAAKEENIRWEHKEFLLSTSTTNIQFEVIRTGLKSESVQKLEFETQTLKSYTIKMSKVYHGTFDIGLINSTLENPTFELVTSPSNPAQRLVKKNEGSNRGVVTAMATFYTSPIILLEDLFGARDIPNYMLSGRNFLEDHKIYERIYPAIGVGFTDRTLNNLFFGFNWEFARGGSLFLGWHYGKVNIYNAPANFEFEQTPVSNDEFNLRKNTAWKTDFAIGLNVDIMIIRNLFRPAVAGAGGQ